VLAEQIGVRNYRKRLAALKKKNPFDQKFALPSPSEAADGAATTDTSGATGGATTSAPSVGTSATEPPISNTEDAPLGTGGSDSSTSPPTTSPTPAPQPEIRFYAGRVDVTVGPLGDAKTMKDVRHLDFLPNDKRPVVAFIGLGEGGEKAVFSVSSDVVESDGDGTCAPKKPQPCQFLTLRVGEQRTLRYVDGETFRLKLLETHIVRIPDPRNDAQGKQPQGDD
jgi:hypothetical protein